MLGTGCQFLSGSASSCLQAHKEVLISASPFLLTPLEGEGLEFPPWRLPQMCLCFSLSSPSPRMCNCFAFTTLGVEGQRAVTETPADPSHCNSSPFKGEKTSSGMLPSIFPLFKKLWSNAHNTKLSIFYHFKVYRSMALKIIHSFSKILVYLFGCAGLSCGMWAVDPQPGVEPSAVGAQSLSHQSPWESPMFFKLNERY